MFFTLLSIIPIAIIQYRKENVFQTEITKLKYPFIPSFINNDTILPPKKHSPQRKLFEKYNNKKQIFEIMSNISNTILLISFTTLSCLPFYYQASALLVRLFRRQFIIFIHSHLMWFLFIYFLLETYLERGPQPHSPAF